LAPFSPLFSLQLPQFLGSLLALLALGFLHSQIRLNRRLVLRAHRHSKAQNGQ
jgi:hypothetical protein